MKAAPFDYLLAHDLDEALNHLEQYGADAKLIAGGQSLVPMMAMRLARPEWLVDINRLQSLKRIDVLDNKVHVGAGVRQRDIEFHAQVHVALPLVKQALQWVGHQQTRNRGTVGGSLVYADPSSELPLSALLLGATFYLESKSEGSRQVQAQDFFLGPMFTSVGETDCLTGIDFPIWSGGKIGCAFEETAIRRGDFAMASAACQLQLDDSQRIVRLSFGLGGMDGTPRVFPDLAQGLLGQTLAQVDIHDLSALAVAQCEPGGDMHASAQYRRHLARVLLPRVIQQAHQHALSSPNHVLS